MTVSEFAIIYVLRAPNVHWFLGAGASAAARVPTAYELIWEFKKILYCSLQRVPITTITDASDPAVRLRIQSFFDDRGGFPPANSDDEYAAYFEAVYPSEADRRAYLDQKISGATPSFGHHALAALLKADKAHGVWTTNFDRVVEDAAAIAYGTTAKLVTATLDSSRIALQALNEGRWPLLTKLHGDFQSTRLKNTSTELREQDANLRRALVEAGRRHGLAVVGYSGRDHSIMDALTDALDDGCGFPRGLFWFRRAGGCSSPQVVELLEKARSRGIDAHEVEITTFDELMGDVFQQIPDLPASAMDQLRQRIGRVTDALVRAKGKSPPIFRLNALAVLEAPSICRRVICRIGGAAEVRSAITNAGTDIIAARRQTGVLAFGADPEIRATFHPYGISRFDVFPIEPQRLRYESAEWGLLYDSLCRALVRDRPLIWERRRQAHLLRVNHELAADPSLAPLRSATGALCGLIPQTKLRWAEAVEVHLDYRLDQLWLLLNPTIWAERAAEDSDANKRKEFIRARLARRYNRQWAEALDGWIAALIGTENETTVSAFGGVYGIDADFTLQRQTAFSLTPRG